MIVYNEEDLLRFTLPQLYYHADQIIIINGSPFGPSTDKTKQVISDVFGEHQTSDSRPGILYREGTYGELFNYKKSFNSVMRNEYLKLATGDFILQLDADEFWSFEDLETIKETINKPENSDITGLNTGNIHFYIDVFHHIPGLGVNMHHRIVRNTPTAYYSDSRPNSILYMGNHRPVATSRRFLELKQVKCFHVGHALPWGNYKRKQSKFFYKNLRRNCWDVKSEEELAALEEQRDFNHPKLKPYEGSYPEYMQEAIDLEHPFFVKRL
jgi:hypothetical protein